MPPNEEHTYLGLDFSTQQLKGVIVGEDLQILHETQVQFDTNLPEFRLHEWDQPQHHNLRITGQHTIESTLKMFVTKGYITCEFCILYILVVTIIVQVT